MRAFIMAAGVGTRLEPLTLAVPKPLVPVCNVPVMQYNIELLKKNGIKDITANLHYFPEQIESYFRDGKTFGVNLTYSFEEELMGTAGGVKIMARSCRSLDDRFVVLSSDVLCDVDLKELISFHKKKNAAATIALVEVDDPSEFGVVILDKNNKITAFQEKPKKAKALSRLANTGLYVFDRSILSMIPDNKIYDFGRQLFPELIKRGLPFYGFRQKGYWKDIGNIKNYKEANIELLKMKSRGKSVLIGKNCRINRNAVLKGNVIVGDNSLIRENAVIKDTIIWPETVIDSGVRIDSSIIGSWCYIESDSVIENNCIIASRCRVRSGSRIASSSFYIPDQVI